MRQTLLSLSAIGLLIIGGCSSRKSVDIGVSYNSEIFNVVVSEPISVDAEELLSDFGYIRLETVPDAFMGLPSNLRVYKDRILLLDRNPESLLMFDMTGKFIRKIGVLGRGPQELLSFTKFDIDYERELVYVIDHIGGKCVFFNMNGDYVRSVNLGDPGGMVAVTQTGFLIHESQTSTFGFDVKKGIQRENIKILDSLGNFVCNGFDYNYNRRINAVIQTLSVNEESQVSFAPLFRDTIYLVNEQMITPLYAFDFSNVKNITKKRSDTYNSESDWRKDLENGYLSLGGEHMDTPDFLYATIGFGLNQSHLFYNKVTGKSINVKNIKGPEGAIFPYRIDDFHDGWFWGRLVGFQQNRLKKMELPSGSVAKKLSDELTEEDTDIIIYFKIKRNEN